MKIYIGVLLLLSLQVCYGAFDRKVIGSRAAAMGGVGVATLHDPWGALINPGQLGLVSTRMASASYTPQSFGLSELSRLGFSYLEPAQFGTFALSATRFGYELYRELTVGLSFGRELYPNVFGGFTLTYNSLAIERYGSDGTMGIDLGFLVRPLNDLSWGFAITNFNRPTIGQMKERLPQTIATGVQYCPISDAEVSLEVMKDTRLPLDIRVGIGCTILDIVDLRVGLSSQPANHTAGVGMQYSFFQIDYAYVSHVILGPTHHFTLTLKLGEE